MGGAPSITIRWTCGEARVGQQGGVEVDVVLSLAEKGELEYDKDKDKVTFALPDTKP